MKCPRCGSEMTMDSHRKMDLMMCYQCGYIEGRRIEEAPLPEGEVLTNLHHLESLNMNEAVAFLAAGLKIDQQVIFDWLEAEYKE